MRVTPISADSFCVSIETALLTPLDIEASMKRIQRALNRLPNGKLIVSNQDSRVVFFAEVDGNRKYLSKKNPLLYSLTRRRYQTMLFNILSLTHSTRQYDIKRRKDLIVRLQQFIRTCEKGNLDIAKIVLSSAQYAWFIGTFRQKFINEEKALWTARGLPVRSKSERDIINKCDDLAVPLHYEERMIINVRSLVDKLEDELLSKGFLRSRTSLYSYINGEIHWNVPPELESMNTHGSIWQTYYPPNGTIEIYNDIKGMFADGSIFIWEHEGLILEFIYRIHASERGSVMKITNAVDQENFIETYENDVDTPEKVIDIIERKILPRLWY